MKTANAAKEQVAVTLAELRAGLMTDDEWQRTARNRAARWGKKPEVTSD
jgi:hypothetical protein